MIIPRYYQVEALDSIYNYFMNGGRGNPLIGLPTGTGKSLIPAIFIEKILKRWPTQRFLMTTTVKELVDQNAKELLGIWPEAPLGIYSAGLKQKDTAHPIIFGSIQSMIKHPDWFGHRDIAFVDEAHLVSAEESSQYQTFFAFMKLINPNLKIIGMSATLYRMGMGMITENGLFTDVVYDKTNLEGFNELLAKGYMAPLIPLRTRTELDVSDVSVSKGEFVATQLQGAVDKSEVTYKALQELVHAGQNRKAWLIFASGIEHAEHIAEQLGAFGVDCAPVHSKRTSEYNDAAIKAFKSGKLRSIVNYGKLTTGFNHPEIDLIGMLRPTLSVPLWCLDADTQILTKYGFKYHDEINETDIVASVKPSTLEHEYVPIEAILKRSTNENENFVSFITPQFNWRVTDKHKMLTRTRYGRERLPTTPKLIDASELINLDRIELPVSANGHNNDLPLSDAELRFIGLFMTDSTLDCSNNAIRIYQSERYPHIIEEIRKCLIECGFKYKERVSPRVPHIPMHIFQISYGKPRGTDKHLSGWSRLSGWIDKDFPIKLMNLSERQFDILLEAIYWGDSQKQPTDVSWQQRSYHISTGNKIFADRLQHTALLNGYRANIAVSHVYMIRMKKQNWNVIQKNNDGRQTIKSEAHSNELVWCVQNKNGTIITRRKGKVVIVGNCQMLGRGTRPAPGKSSCLVLDFARNTPRLGPINDPVIPKMKKGEAGEMPIKICESCGCYNHTKVRFCTNCGEEFTFQQKLVSKAGTEELIRAATIEPLPIIETFDVIGAHYVKHDSKSGKPPTLKVTYFTPGLPFTEYVCLEHSGMAGKMGRDWWRRRLATEPPITIDEALKHVAQLKKPRYIRVHVNKRYPEILAAEF